MLIIGVTLMEMNRLIMGVEIVMMLKVDWQMLMKETGMKFGTMIKIIMRKWNFH